MTIQLNPQRFDELTISKGLKKALANESFIEMKPIQSQAIPHLLAGRNVLGASPTGSGKTLAFLVPAIELLTCSRARPAYGTIAIILSPSRELALQTFELARTLMKELSPTPMCIVGGQKGFKDEEYTLRTKGANLLVATPGRLRQHLEGGYIKLDHFQFLIIDEADRMLEAGFADDLYAIFEHIKNPQQTALFSATLTKDVEGLMKLNMTKIPVFCSPTNASVVVTLEHCYSIVPFEHRVAVLTDLLMRFHAMGKRVVCFFSNRKEAVFLTRLMNALDIPCDSLNGDMSQSERNIAFVKFNRNETHILLATNLASRGLDFPNVDWSISVGPPDKVKDYVHRAGRTARNEKFGRSLLLLAPNEESFAKRIRKHKITVKKIELEFTQEEIDDIKRRIEQAMASSRQFTDLAIEAALGFENTYQARPPEEGIRFDDVDMNDVRISFGLEREGKF